jgi:hypothetical protein
VLRKRMQEILLFGQVPAQDHATLRQQLSGVTRMQPQSVTEKHLIFKPIQPPGLNNPPTGNGAPGPQQQELQKTRLLLNAPLSYVQLVGMVERNGIDSLNEAQTLPPTVAQEHDVAMTEERHGPNKSQEPALEWYLEWRDIPEPGKVSTTSRGISRTRIVSGDPIQSIKNLGYEYVLTKVRLFFT